MFIQNRTISFAYLKINSENGKKWSFFQPIKFASTESINDRIGISHLFSTKFTLSITNLYANECVKRTSINTNAFGNSDVS